MKNKTKSGFEYEIDSEAVDDWELVEVLSESNPNSGEYIQTVKTVLGADQYKGLKAYLKDKEGKVKITSMLREFEEIISSVQLKN